MKIAWYTPFSANSAIGRFSRIVTKALRAQGSEIQIIRSETRTTETRAAGSVDPNESCIWAADFRRNLSKQLASYDIVVYNLGDHYDNHAYCFSHQTAAPGLTVLHDYSLHNALYRHCLRSPVAVGNYRDQLAVECGPKAARLFDHAVDSGELDRWWDHDVVEFPIYRWALQDTLGVVTHAEFYRGLVARRIGCPTVVIPLAYDSAGADGLKKVETSEQEFTILTVGTVNANKRYASVIEALARSPQLRQNCHYRIVGPADDEQRRMIQQACSSWDPQPKVTVVGEVSREQLANEFARADVISCLRHPVFEGASASAVEGLLSGKPVIVSKVGCYKEIPDAVVFKVSPESEDRELSRVLHGIFDDYATARQRALAAQSWARSQFSADAYARQIVQFAERVLYNRPALRVVDRLAGHLQRWNAGATDQVVQRIDSAIQDLFADPARSREAA